MKENLLKEKKKGERIYSTPTKINKESNSNNNEKNEMGSFYNHHPLCKLSMDEKKKKRIFECCRYLFPDLSGHHERCSTKYIPAGACSCFQLKK